MRVSSHQRVSIPSPSRLNIDDSPYSKLIHLSDSCMDLSEYGPFDLIPLWTYYPPRHWHTCPMDASPADPGNGAFFAITALSTGPEPVQTARPTERNDFSATNLRKLPSVPSRELSFSLTHGHMTSRTCESPAARGGLGWRKSDQPELPVGSRRNGHGGGHRSQ